MGKMGFYLTVIITVLFSFPIYACERFLHSDGLHSRTGIYVVLKQSHNHSEEEAFFPLIKKLQQNAGLGAGVRIHTGNVIKPTTIESFMGSSTIEKLIAFKEIQNLAVKMDLRISEDVLKNPEAEAALIKNLKDVGFYVEHHRGGVFRGFLDDVRSTVAFYKCLDSIKSLEGVAAVSI